ncbi:MAG TPA: cation diffusion facilitator family transporter [Flavipsychrobacter sp.]|jgi:cobalt-zinc-cadmium efflux system protein|nr:cation diffusion facilitator family transporter [Flavipsychrobacter sp.]
MSHQHTAPTTKSSLTFTFWLNLLFSIVEFVGGIFTNSTAIMADAFHDFMDAIAIGIAVLLDKFSKRKRTTKFSYGYKRFSLLSALGLSLFLLAGSLAMLYSAVHSFIQPHTVNSMGMLWLALLGIMINGFAFLRLKKSNSEIDHQHAHSHSHTHSTDYNKQAILWHLLEDVLGWVAVLVGSIVIYFTGWYWLDGCLAIGIAVFIGYNASKNLIQTMRILLQSVPEHIDLEALKTELVVINGVQDIHDLHVWSMDGNYHVASIHVVLVSDNSISSAEVMVAIQQVFEAYHIHHPTIQIESSQQPCNLNEC